MSAFISKDKYLKIYLFILPTISNLFFNYILYCRFNLYFPKIRKYYKIISHFKIINSLSIIFTDILCRY